MTFTIQEVFAMPAFKKGRMASIKKEMPPGSGRWFLFGFEARSKNSRRYTKKFMLTGPISIDDLPNRKAQRIATRRAIAADKPGGAGAGAPKAPAGEDGVVAPPKS